MKSRVDKFELSWHIWIKFCYLPFQISDDQVGFLNNTDYRMLSSIPDGRFMWTPTRSIWICSSAIDLFSGRNVTSCEGYQIQNPEARTKKVVFEVSERMCQVFLARQQTSSQAEHLVDRDLLLPRPNERL